MVFLVNLARVVFAPLLEPLKGAFGVGDATVGLLATLAWLGSASPRLPVGYLLTRVDRTHVVGAAGGVLTVSALLAAAAPTIEVLMGCAFCLGLSSGAYFIAGNPLVSELFPDRVGSALGVHGASSHVAAVLAAPFVGLVLAVDDWRLAFRALAVVAALGTLVLLVVARRTALPTAGSADRDLFGAARRQWRLVLAGVAFIGATGLVWNGVFNFYDIYLSTARTLPPGASRDMLTVLFAAGLPAFLVSGRLADHLPNVPYVLGICGAFAASLFLLTLTTGYWQLLAVSALLGYVIHSVFPAMDTYLLSSLPDENRASAYAVYSATMMLIQATGSSVVGLLRDAGFAFDAVFQGAAAALGVVLVVLVVLYADGRLPTGAAAGDRV
jgi:predicted MFS family arabinose efflux permease